ncbi:MAG: type II toxin-antitoxin system PemK/MazF family toxin [Candidatus Eremiobacteraeota bacterium]|nr:type II toxin-antitoxin system PemK/MazF family toxin [Candidatus Eremiobacteraeota bacterium]MBV8284753.1 type II toxin-antitoxin system PemK/MazF family toxin [Candidatus Eremiobacteraeota bacterium]
MLCDQIRAIDRQRLRRLAGVMNETEFAEVLRTLQTIFAD